MKKGKTYISVTIVDDDSIKSLNKKYREVGGSTDVLSFNINEKLPDGIYLGDVVVNEDQAKKQAGNYGNTYEQEIADLVSHGVLHLLGVHHEGDK